MIWLTGQDGRLGRALGRALDQAGLAWTGTGHEVDIADPQAVEAFARGRSFTWIVNAAAYTAVDRAETEPEACHRTNAGGAQTLALWAERHEAALVQFSTDYVFSGDLTRPYGEDDPLGPLSVYGASKAAGEALVRQACARHVILRTSWLYGPEGGDFVSAVLAHLGQGRSMRVVADQTGSPTWTEDLAGQVVRCLSGAGVAWGTYHLAGQGQTTWYGFAQAIAGLAEQRRLVPEGAAALLRPVTRDQYPTAARRPAQSALDGAKWARATGGRLLPWQDALARFLY